MLNSVVSSFPSSKSVTEHMTKSNQHVRLWSYRKSIILKRLMNLKNLCIFIFPAICGAAIVYSITPNNSIGSLGVTAPANGVSTAQAFVVELVLTFILVFVVFAATDPGRGLTGYGVPLAIGICVFICLMHGVGLLATNISLKAYESDGLSKPCLVSVFLISTKFVFAIAFLGHRDKTEEKATGKRCLELPLTDCVNCINL